MAVLVLKGLDASSSFRVPLTQSGQVTARSCAACRAALQAALQSGQQHNVRHFTCVNVHPVASLRPKVMTARLLMGEVRPVEGCFGRSLILSSAAKGCIVHSVLDGRRHCASYPKSFTDPEQGGTWASEVHAGSSQTQHAGFQAKHAKLFPHGPVKPMQAPAARSWCLAASIEMPAIGIR